MVDDDEAYKQTIVGIIRGEWSGQCAMTEPVISLN